MDIGASFVAHREATKSVQPSQGPFDDPAQDAEAAAMRTARLRHDGENALVGEPGVSGRRPVGAVPLNDTRLAPRPARFARDRRQRRDHRLKLRHVVDVGGGELGDQRNAVRVGDEVVLRAFLTAIGWVRSSFFPPRSARSEALSITVHRWSSRPRRFSSASSVSCTRRQTPARCQRTSRRQHVLPEPHPISLGSICQGTPDRRTYRIPVNTARSGMGVRP